MLKEMIKAGNEHRTKWAVYTRHYRYGSPGDSYVGTITDNRVPEDIAKEICKRSRRKHFEVKIGAIIIL